MMGRGFLKRAARMKASSWVLSPISASATTPVETRRDSMGLIQWALRHACVNVTRLGIALRCVIAPRLCHCEGRSNPSAVA